jgi:hypothetical protein
MLLQESRHMYADTNTVYANLFHRVSSQKETKDCHFIINMTCHVHKVGQ